MQKLKYLILIIAIGLIGLPFIAKPEPIKIAGQEARVITRIITPTPAPTIAPQIIYLEPRVVPTNPPITTAPIQQPNITNITYVNPTGTPTPTETPIPDSITIAADGHSYKANISGGNAWDAISGAIGVSNLTYTDYGGSLGKFITGFNGHNAGENEFWEFNINGVSSNVGVSSYIPVNGDVLSFVLKTF